MIVEGLVNLWIGGAANTASVVLVGWTALVCWVAIRDEYSQRKG
jgi:hypothetical protein